MISGICPPGTYSNDGLTPCTPCPNNFYALAYASQSCAACPDDRVTNATGASSESECKTLTELGNGKDNWEFYSMTSIAIACTFNALLILFS